MIFERLAMLVVSRVHDLLDLRNIGGWKSRGDEMIGEQGSLDGGQDVVQTLLVRGVFNFATLIIFNNNSIELSEGDKGRVECCILI